MPGHILLIDIVKPEPEHDLEWDPPHALSNVRRWTCRRCGRAKLVNGDVTYGSATTEPCEED